MDKFEMDKMADEADGHARAVKIEQLLAKWQAEIDECNNKRFHCQNCGLIAKIMKEMRDELIEALQ